MGQLPSNTEVNSVVMLPRQVAFIFLLDNGNVMYGKIGKSNELHQNITIK